LFRWNLSWNCKSKRIF